jgi:hypothetical protein
MRVCIQLLSLKHYWNISAGSCLTILLTALISLLATKELVCNYNNREELKEDVKMWLISHVADIFDTGLHKLVPRYDRCLSSSGDYVDK